MTHWKTDWQDLAGDRRRSEPAGRSSGAVPAVRGGDGAANCGGRGRHPGPRYYPPANRTCAAGAAVDRRRESPPQTFRGGDDLALAYAGLTDSDPAIENHSGDRGQLDFPGRKVHGAAFSSSAPPTLPASVRWCSARNRNCPSQLAHIELLQQKSQEYSGRMQDIAGRSFQPAWNWSTNIWKRSQTDSPPSADSHVQLAHRGAAAGRAAAPWSRRSPS